jgi:hypothetical protein
MGRRRGGRSALISGLAAINVFGACSARSNQLDEFQAMEVVDSVHRRCVLHEGTLTEMKDGGEPADADTLLTILMGEPGTDNKVATGRWLATHEHFEFRGQRNVVCLAEA